VSRVRRQGLAVVVAIVVWGLAITGFGLAVGFAGVSPDLMLAVAVLMLANIVVAASLNERGVNAVLTPLVIVLSGSLVPLDFFPDAVRPLLHVQPFAGLVDIPFRIYFADLRGAAALQGLALQAGWTLALIGLGRLAMAQMMRRLEMQGG
jgi:ABC-2 type transport system permease protein